MYAAFLPACIPLADHCRAYVVVDGWEGVPLSSVSFLGNTSDLMDREVMTSFC